MQSVEITTNSAEETQALGIALGQSAQSGDVLALVGDLGAGKTTLVQGVGIGLGIADAITSPTFTLVGEYQGRLHVYHVDVYRLADATTEAVGIGLDDFFNEDGLTMIEWANLIELALPKDFLRVQLTWVSENERRVVFEARGTRAENWLRAALSGRHA